MYIVGYSFIIRIMTTYTYLGTEYKLDNTSYNNLVNYILDTDSNNAVDYLIKNYKITELRNIINYLTLNIKSTKLDVLADKLVTALTIGNVVIGMIRSEYLENLMNQEVEKSNVDVSRDLPIDNNDFSTCLDSFSMFGMDTSINDISVTTTNDLTDVTVKPITVKQQEIKPTNTTKVVNDITTNKTKNLNLTYEQL